VEVMWRSVNVEVNVLVTKRNPRTTKQNPRTTFAGPPINPETPTIRRVALSVARMLMFKLAAASEITMVLFLLFLLFLLLLHCRRAR
jgi:hypothetical protein